MIRYRRSPEALSAEVGEDVVALQAEHGFAFSMEGVTAAVWRQLEEPVALEQILASLQEDYEVSDERCRTEVAALLEQLVAEGLVEEIR
jgi:hypothetical protein